MPLLFVRAAAAAVLLVLCAVTATAQAGRAAYNEGRRLLERGEAKDAVRQFERAIDREPNVGLYHQWLGNALGVEISTASAVRQPFLARRLRSALERAVELDPSLLDARAGLLQYYLQAPGVLGGSRDAAAAQQRAIAERDAMRGHLAAASIAQYDKDTSAADAAFRRAVAAAPDSLLPTMTYASRLLAWGRGADALTLLDTFRRRRPQDAAARYQFARVAVLTERRLDEAERLLRELVADSSWDGTPWSPSRAVLHARLGDALRLQGRAAQARAEYERALALQPSLQLAKDGLSALR